MTLADIADVRNDDGVRFTLRPYQREALERIAFAEACGTRKQLGVAATGLGKTVVFCALAAERDRRTLILAHRDELVSQAVKKVREIWPSVDVGIVKAELNDVDSKVIVASVQTLARERRLQQLVDASGSLLRPVEPFDLVVIDEAHHTAADSYRRIVEALRAGECDGPLLLGVTATPDRGDGQGLDDLFDEVVWNFDILWGIRAGWLADVRAKRVVLDRLDMSGVRVRRGDYDAGQAGAALEAADAPDNIVQSWRTHAADRQTIVFTPTVALADQVRDAFRHAGIRAAMVSGETPRDERRATLHAYATGDIQVVANCAVLTEGFDDPRTDCIVVARPTKSRALFTQMVGRGTRKHPEKDHLLVLDVVGASHMHSLITVPSLFGIPETDVPDLERQNLTDVIDAVEQRKVIAGQLKAEEANLFAAMRSQGIAWVKFTTTDGRVRFQRTLTHGKPTVCIAQRDRTDEESWACWLRYDNRKVRNGDGVYVDAARTLIRDVSLELAQGVGEDACRKLTGGRMHLIDANAPWRKQPRTRKQMTKARSLGIDVKQFKTRGELADEIDRVKATQR